MLWEVGIILYPTQVLVLKRVFVYPWIVMMCESFCDYIFLWFRFFPVKLYPICTKDSKMFPFHEDGRNILLIKRRNLPLNLQLHFLIGDGNLKRFEKSI